MSVEGVMVYVLKPKDRPTLQLQWVDPVRGKRKTCSAKTSDPAAAELARSDLQFRLRNGLYQEQSKLDWKHFRELFEQEHVAGLRESTREKYACVLDVFEQIVNPAKLRAIDERVLSQFVRGMRERKRRGKKEPGLARWTMRNYLISLKKAIGWAVEQKLLPTMPNFPKVKAPKKKPQPIPAESFERLLLKAPNALWRAFLLCGWWAGLRLSEVRELRWEKSDRWPWIDFEGNRVMLPAAFAKSGADQLVPLHPTLRRTLAELPRSCDKVFPFRSRMGGGPLSRSGISNRIITMAKRAGVKLSMHALRKSFGCRIAKRFGKGSAPVLHELMRHASMQTTMDFYANVDDVLQEVVNDLT